MRPDSLQEPTLDQLRILARHAHESGVEVTHGHVVSSLWRSWHKGKGLVPLTKICDYLVQCVHEYYDPVTLRRDREHASRVLDKFLEDLRGFQRLC